MLLLFLTLLFVVIGIVMHRRQNTGEKLGGEISPAKSIWLFYCIYTWLFFVPYALLFYPIPEPYKTTWIIFTTWFWIRSVAEAIMLFKTHNWTPPIGITHDLSCLVILLAVPLYIGNGSKHGWEFSPYLLFHASLILSLILETYYAFAFFQLVGQKTKGEKGIWYASKSDPQFKRIVFITTLGNIPVLVALVLFTCHLVID